MLDPADKTWPMVVAAQKSPVSPVAKHCRFCATRSCTLKADVHGAKCARLCGMCHARSLIACRFGLTLRNYVYLYDDIHKGKCGICSRTATYRSKKRQHIRLSIDHIHLEPDQERQRLAAQLGLIRGVLCGSCNAEVDLSDLLENREYYIDTKGPKHHAKARMNISFYIYIIQSKFSFSSGSRLLHTAACGLGNGRRTLDRIGKTGYGHINS